MNDSNEHPKIYERFSPAFLEQGRFSPAFLEQERFSAAAFMDEDLPRGKSSFTNNSHQRLSMRSLLRTSLRSYFAFIDDVRL